MKLDWKELRKAMHLYSKNVGSESDSSDGNIDANFLLKEISVVTLNNDEDQLKALLQRCENIHEYLYGINFQATKPQLEEGTYDLEELSNSFFKVFAAKNITSTVE